MPTEKGAARCAERLTATGGHKTMAWEVSLSGLNRHMQVLRLFSEEKSNWTVPEIAAQIEVPASTVYRTVRELVSQEMLEQSTEALYRLGSAFIEFDRLVRVTDPLIKAGSGLLSDLVAQTEVPCTAVLARLYGNTVMCVADAQSKLGHPPTTLERGRPRPLTRGATSKMILAQLPARRLNKLLGGADPLDRFRKELLTVRKAGYVIARGEVDEGIVGIAAPVLMPELAISASLCLVVSASMLTSNLEHRLILLTTMSAKLLTNRLTDSGQT